MDKAPTPLTVDDEARWKALQTLAWNIGKRPIEELSEIEVAFCGAFWRAKAAKSHVADLERRLSALQADARDGAYYKWRLEKIMPLFQEARDALPAISLASAKLRGLDLTLGDRMDEAGRPQRAEWDAALNAREGES